MRDRISTKLTLVRIWLVQIVAILFLLQIASGLPLAFLFNPSLQPSTETYAGSPVERRNGIRTILDTNTGKTIFDTADADIHQEWRSNQGYKGETIAHSSVRTRINTSDVAYMCRKVHHGAMHTLVVLSMLLICLLVLEQAYHYEKGAWIRALVLAAVLLLSVWSGLLLPDNGYSDASRAATGLSLPGAPLGDVLADIFGVRLGDAHAERAFAMHILVLPVVLFACLTPYVRHLFKGNYGWKRTTLLVSIGVLMSIVQSLFSNGIDDSDSYMPSRAEWMLRPAQNFEAWLGEELAGYLTLAILLALISLPWWHNRMGASFVRIVLGISGLLLVLGLAL